MDGTVLVADDDRTIRTVLTQALTRQGGLDETRALTPAASADARARRSGSASMAPCKSSGSR